MFNLVMSQLAPRKLVMLRKTDEFSSVFSFRKRFSSKFLVLHYKPSPDTQVKIGFVVAKKMAKLAVDRNYMRRVLRELCRQELHVLSAVNTAGVDVVIQVKTPFKNADFFQLKQELAGLFVKTSTKITTDNIIHA